MQNEIEDYVAEILSDEDIIQKYCPQCGKKTEHIATRVEDVEGIGFANPCCRECGHDGSI